MGGGDDIPTGVSAGIDSRLVRPSLRLAVSSVVAASMLATSCLSSSYTLSRDELSRLARTPPAQRWQAVRATQRILGGDTAPDATEVGAPSETVVVPATYWFDGRWYNVPGGWQRARSGVSVRVPTVATSSRGGGRSASSGGSSGGGSGGGRGGEAVVVLVVVVAAAVMVFVLAGTEGARYDGWLGLPPDEPLYVDQADGSLVAVPLSGLTPELADNARGAAVYEGPSARYLQLGRAPLNRRGLSVQSALVTAAVPRLDDPSGGWAVGVGGRAFLGGFPVQQVGVGATTDVMGTTDGTVIANVGAEAQVMPLTSVGAYVGAGWSWIHPGASGRRLSTWNLRAGAQFELPFTTRLTGSLRAGVTRYAGDASAPDAWSPELTLGLSVY